MKTNLLHSLKANARVSEKRSRPKSGLTILAVLIIALAHAGCETTESGAPGAVVAPSSSWPAAATGPSGAGPSLAASLSGQWYHDGKPTSIRVDPDGRNLTIIDENGHRTSGVATSPYELDFRGLKGSVGHGGRRISWNNGTTWTREPGQGGSHLSHGGDQNQGLSGRWYHDGRPTSVSISPGGGVTITDENGQTTIGHMSGNGEIMMSSFIRGSVSSDGRRISWSNGTTWTR